MYFLVYFNLNKLSGGKSMIKHLVLWKIRDDDDKQKNIDTMIKMLSSLVGKIEGLVSIEVGYAYNDNAEYDVALYGSFKNPVALKYYQTHPEHVKCKEFISKITEGRVSVDYFYEKENASALPLSRVKDVPGTEPEAPAAPAPSAQATPPAPPAPPTPAAAPASQKPNSTVKETTNMFGKKKVGVEVTPLNERSDTWTCPKCGKVMPNYVGTCGCGEPKPFEFEPPIPTAPSAPAPAAPSAPAAPAVPKPNSTVKETTNIFGKKKVEVEVTPLDERSDTWTCPRCGKVMPNYVGTCGCGEPKPFEFDDESYDDGSYSDEPYDDNSSDGRMTYEEMQELQNAEPSLQSYNPMAEKTDPTPPEEYSYIKNDANNAQAMPAGFDDAPPARPMTFNDPPPAKPMTFNDAPPAKPMTFDDLPPAKPMTFDDAPPAKPMTFDDAPPAKPMTFDDLPPAKPMTFDNAPPAKPMTFDDLPPAKPMRFDDSQTGDEDEGPAFFSRNKNKTPPPPPAPEPKPKHAFGKKARENEAYEQAVATVRNRKDVPNDGTWTCPKCGKVMPKYVGTCGCGEQQPFDF